MHEKIIRKTPEFKALRAEAREVADEHGGKANEAGDEIIVARPGGDEIARWELLK